MLHIHSADDRLIAWCMNETSKFLYLKYLFTLIMIIDAVDDYNTKDQWPLDYKFNALSNELTRQVWFLMDQKVTLILNGPKGDLNS